MKGNPFQDRIEVLFPGITGEVNFRLIDSKGSIVLMKTELINGGGITLFLKNKQLSNGVYILEANINGQQFTEKLVKK